MRRIIRTIGLLALDIFSAILLTLGGVLLSLPIVLHLTLGADNDAYIEIGEWGGAKPNILGYFGLEWMFRIDFLLWLALLIIVGLGLRGLLWVLLARRAATSPALPTGPANPGHSSSVRRWMLIAFMSLCVVAVVLAVLFAYCGKYWQALQGKPAYLSPEESMRAFIREHYIGLQEVEIVRVALQSPLNNLCFVEARVWAERRTDGRIVSANGDNPACFFLHMDRGWILVPESMRPELLAISQCLFY